MFGNLEEIQKNLKEKLDSIHVEDSTGDGLIKIVATGGKEIKNISIDASLLSGGDKEELEDLLVVAINRVLNKADMESAAVTKEMMSSILPPGFNLPGMF